MALQFSGKAETTYSLVPKGEYEVKLRVEYDKTKTTGAQYIKVTSIIRDDIKQDIDGQGGRLVFDGIYKDKNTGIYNENKINYILSAIPNAKLDFEDYDELVQYLNDQLVKIIVDHERKDKENPDSELKAVAKKYVKSDLLALNAEKQYEIKDGDLPF